MLLSNTGSHCISQRCSGIALILHSSLPMQDAPFLEHLTHDGWITISRTDGGLEEVGAACSKNASSILVIDVAYIRLHTRDRIRKFIRNTPSTRVLVYMKNSDRAQQEELLLTGCFGFIDEETPTAAWETIVRSVVRGEMWVDHSVFTGAFQTALAAADECLFSPREGEILSFLARGLSNQAIAEQLFVAPATIRWHLRHLYAKAGVSSRHALGEYAARHVRGVSLVGTQRAIFGV